jgi:hypothetical protein
MRIVRGLISENQIYFLYLLKNTNKVRIYFISINKSHTRRNANNDVITIINAVDTHLPTSLSDSDS